MNPVQDLTTQVAALREELAELRQEKEDLETLLEMTTAHSDLVEEELHQETQQALRESERRLRLILATTPFPMLIFKQETGRVVYANDEVAPALGLDEAVGQRVLHFFEDREALRQLVTTIDENGVSHREMALRHQQGHIVWVELSARPLVLDDQPAWLCAFVDITERRRQFVASSRFVPTEFLEFFDKQSIVDLELGDFISQEMTVMFSDVRSFLTMSESMTPQQNFKFVNAYFRRVSPVVRQNGGFIVKYLGDGMMAVFPKSADDAVVAGLKKLERVNQYNKEREKKGYIPVKVGIGVHTGHMMVGMVGEANRMQGDAFSDDVNLASRLEGLTKFYDTSLIISEETRSKLKDPDEYRIRFLDRVRVKGRQAAIHLYEVFEHDPYTIRCLKDETLDDLTQAQDLFYCRKFRQAQRLLFKILQKSPDDKLFWHYLMKATQYLEHGVPANWDGVTVMKSK